MIKFYSLLEQPDEITCGPTSATMVLKYYGIDANIDEVKKLTRTTWYTHKQKDYGMTAPVMISIALNHYGLNSVMKTGSMKRIKSVVSQNTPCIVLVRSGEYTMHYVVVVGYDNNMIFYANPTDASITGISESEFMDAWSWNSDLYGRKCSSMLSFWLNALEIYPCTYISTL